MADFEENVEEMMGTTREVVLVATESGGYETGDVTGGPVDETDDETAAMAGDETAATGEVMYTDKGELEFDEDETTALEGQRLVAEFRCELFHIPGLSFEGFHASEPARNLRGGDDSGSEAVTKSDDDEGVTGHLSDAPAATAYRTNPNLPD